MTSKELVSAALMGKPTPRVPVGPLSVHFCARVAGHSLREYTTGAQVLTECVIRYYERFKPDAVWVSADTWVSAEAMGARVGATDDNQPFGGLGEPLVRSAADIDRIPVPNVDCQGRYPLMIEALARVAGELGKDVFIVGCFDQYPFSLAAALMGLNAIMLKIVDDPPFVRALMERCEEYALAYARAMAEAGADMLSGGDSPAGLIGPGLYREVALPHEQRLIARLRASTAKPISLHICGKASPILPFMRASGADVLELDHGVEVAEACRIIGPDIGLWGNLDPVAVLAQGTPGLVREEARKVRNTISALGHRRFVLSSGCTLAPETPYANVEALLASAD